MCAVLSQRGAARDRHRRGKGCGGRRRRQRRGRCLRTAKTCGPAARMLVSSSRKATFAGDGGKKAGRRGEHDISRKPLRGECRIASAEPVCSYAFLLCTVAHETAGAARTRCSLRPLIEEGG